MNTIHEIEHAIKELTPQELRELYVWLDQHCPEPIDARVASDISAGHLNDLVLRALSDEENGRTRSL